MFSSAEQLSAVHRAEHTQRLVQSLKHQHQLRAQQLSRQSPSSCLTPGQTDLEKGIFQDPFLGAGVLGSVLLRPSQLPANLTPGNLPVGEPDKQQVNGKVANGLSEAGQAKRHHTFGVTAQVAAAATHMLHQQRTSTLRKQLAKRTLEQQGKLKELKEQSSFEHDKTANKPMTRFLKKSNAVRPVQLQHSLSLSSFAGFLPKYNHPNAYNGHPFNSQYSSPVNQVPFTGRQLRLTVEKPKYGGVDKNVMTIKQQPITLDHLLYGSISGQPKSVVSKSVQDIERPVTWLDTNLDHSLDHSLNHNLDHNLDHNLVANLEYEHQMNDQMDDQMDDHQLEEHQMDPSLPPLPVELLENRRRKSSSPLKSRSMPSVNLINQPEHALFANPYYLEEQPDDGAYPFAAFHPARTETYAFHPASTQAFQPGLQEPCALHSSISHLLQQNSQDDAINVFQDHQQRARLAAQPTFGSAKRINSTAYTAEPTQWPDAQLQQFLSAFNHYTQQRPAVNRNHTRSLFDLY